jgi:putative copper resistance protein D
MAQHLLIADVAAPFLLIGLRTPVYAFMLPPRLMAPIARSPSLRRAFRFVRLPWIAAALWVIVLYGWHFAGPYDAALRSPVLHALQHQAFIVTSMLVWLSVLEPARRRTPGGLWKIGHIGAVRLAGMFLGMAFVAARNPFYDGFYGNRAVAHGLTPLEDQQIAGALMLSVDFTVMIATLVLVFFRSAQDADIEEERERALAARTLGQAPDPSAAAGVPALGGEQ